VKSALVVLRPNAEGNMAVLPFSWAEYVGWPFSLRLKATVSLPLGLLIVLASSEQAVVVRMSIKQHNVMLMMVLRLFFMSVSLFTIFQFPFSRTFK